MLEEINIKLQEGKIIEKLAGDKKLSKSELSGILENLVKVEADVVFRANLVDGSRSVNGRQYFFNSKYWLCFTYDFSQLTSRCKA